MSTTFPIPPNPNPDGYISFPITVDANTLLSQAIQDIQAKIPGWQPYEGQLDTIILEEVAQMMTVVAAIASQVPVSIFIYWGQLVGIMPLRGVAATVPALFTMVDTAGYTIPQGLQIAFPITGSSSILFTVETPLVIPPGESTGTTTLICTEVGSFPNGLAADTFLFVQQTLLGLLSIETTDVVAGGVDPDTVTSYINRLSDKLQLIAPRPILPHDFAEMAQNVDGVFRALAIDGLNPGRTVTGCTTTNGSATVGIPGVQALDVGRTITDSLGYIPMAQTIASVNVGAQTAVITPGVASNTAIADDVFTLGDLTGQERCVTVCGVDVNGAALSSPLQSEMVAYLNAMREVNFLVFSIDPTITEVDVSVTYVPVVGADTGTVTAAIETTLTNFLNPASWAGGNEVPPEWDNLSTVSLLDLASIILTVSGVAYIALGDLLACIHGGTLASADVNLPGDAPLPTVGTLTIGPT